MNRTFSKPPPPSEATPYTSIDEAVDDLAREVQAQLSLVRRLRERNGGLPGKGLGNFRHLTLPESWIVPLAQGATLREGSREWTVALLACHAEMPVEAWRSLCEACHAWRCARLERSPATFPLRQLLPLEAQLEPWIAAMVVCDMVHAAGNDLNQVMQRCTYGEPPTRDLTTYANLLGEDRSTRSRSNFQALFGASSLVVRLGIYDPPGSDDKGSPPEFWEPHLCRHLA